MTLINIADGTEGECRSKGGWRRSLSAARRTSRGRQLERDRDGRGWREGEKGVTGGERWERGRVEGMVWVFIISPSRLDSVKLWNNPLMSLPCRVDRMPTKLPDFPLFLPALSFPSFLPSLSPISLSLSLLFQRHPPLPQTHPTPLFAALHSSEAGIPIIAGLVSLYEFALCTLDRLNCIRFARDTRDFVFALRVNDQPFYFSEERVRGRGS